VNALAILRRLAGAAPLGVNALARALGLNPSTCFNILKTLVAEEFVDFDPVAKTYRLGSAPAKLFQAEPDLTSWTNWMCRELGAIALEFSITCGLWQVWGDRVILTEVAESTRATRIHLTLGQRLPNHLGAMGRCIAAREGLSLAEIAEVLPTLRWQSPPSPERYFRDMRLAVSRGWSVDEGDYLRGVTTVAAGIGGKDGGTQYCLTSTLFTGQHDDRDLGRIGDRTAALARAAEARLIGKPNPDGAVADDHPRAALRRGKLV
jgi:DNA-binding IclR family transcriptional regulator